MNPTRRTFLTSLLAAPAALFALTRVAKATTPVTDGWRTVDAPWPPEIYRPVIFHQQTYVAMHVESVPSGWLLTLSYWAGHEHLTQGRYLASDLFLLPHYVRGSDVFCRNAYLCRSGSERMGPSYPMRPISNVTLDVMPWEADKRAKLPEWAKDAVAVVRWIEGSSGLPEMPYREGLT